MKIAVGASSFTQEIPGYEVMLNPYGRKMSEEELISHLHDVDGLLAGLEILDETVFRASPKLKAISRIGVGMDNVDIEAANRYGIKVSNTPEGPTYAVAEMVLSALLCIARQILPANRNIHNGIWKKRMGFSLNGSTILLVGYGRIAKEFERLLVPFEAIVLKYDPLLNDNKPLQEFLPYASIVSLHASGSNLIIGKDELSIMQDGAVLLNSARGGLVDEDAVYDALKTGKLSWYWADVFSEEPYSGKLAELDNALLTPHIATYTEQCRKQMEIQAVKNLLTDLEQR
jgi:D-3-phosphoglycerate dehydrogenase